MKPRLHEWLARTMDPPPAKETETAVQPAGGN
jgi:hypothetical protein